MITWLITALVVAMFTATVVVFLNALLAFYDYVVGKIKKAFKAIKLLVKKKNSNRVDGKILVQTNEGMQAFSDTTKVQDVDINEFTEKNPELAQKLQQAEVMSNGEQWIAADLEPEAEQAIRSRAV